MDRNELVTMAKAFETNVEGLAKLTGYTRGGLYVRKNSPRKRVELVRNALILHSENLYRQEVKKAENMLKTRQLWIDEFCGGAEG